MRCIACNKALTEFESTRKSAETGEFIDLCNYCYSTIKESTLADEREDLREEEYIDKEVFGDWGDHTGE